MDDNAMTISTDDLMKQHGVRATPKRRMIYDTLATTTDHPTADELFVSVRNKMPCVSLATVYNTLEVFSEVGLILKVPGNGNSNHYDAKLQDHLHARCCDSGAVRDVPDTLSREVLDSIPDDVIAEIESRLGFKVEQLQIQLIGKYAEPV